MTARPKPTNDQVLTWWVENAGTIATTQWGREFQEAFNKKYLDQTGSVDFTNDGTELNHYGHFTIARIVKTGRNPRGLFLLNGDRYSGGSGWGPSTSHIQEEVRALVERSGVPWIIIPFSCLQAARIDYDSIRPVEVLKDTYTWQEHIAPTFSTVPSWIRDSYVYARDNHTEDMAADGYRTYGIRGFRAVGDGRWRWEAEDHILGASLFRATYTTRWPAKKRALFLSGFDAQEGPFAYFLCQLPASARVSTVDEAYEALKPEAVVIAEMQGLDVLRQGDIFAIPRPRDTIAGDIQRMAYVLGTNHAATEVVTAFPGAPYARGILWHKPANRPPDHRRVALGDRKTWYRLVKNTVPVVNGQSRAWSPPGGNGRARVD